ncbi:hypothetical protein LTR64_007739 [Lithohypha guttulata]|uniref:uncharacterized protein n=1 Tax=Lithohypha guttulata TaxID=1690604 RepID=UPI002DDE8BB5|nr:hypothetical protein LTR51_007249 [Lithohypha guttulata]
MSVVLRRTGSNKRHTWPRTKVDQLETIPESPQTLSSSKFTAQEAARDQRAKDERRSVVLDTKSDKFSAESASSVDIQAQMIWYSHRLEESLHDRQRLTTRIKELEAVCKNQAKAQDTVLKDVKVWRQNYGIVEAELVEAAQEIVEVREYVRALETSNANLRYALSQAREEQECSHRTSWCGRIRRCLQRCWSFPQRFQAAVHGPKKNDKRVKPHKSSLLQPESRLLTPHSNSSRTSIPESGRCSRMGAHPVTIVPDSSPLRSLVNGEKG